MTAKGYLPISLSRPCPLVDTGDSTPGQVQCCTVLESEMQNLGPESKIHARIWLEPQVPQLNWHVNDLPGIRSPSG